MEKSQKLRQKIFRPDKFSAAYKINTQKLLAFLFNNNEHPEKDIRRFISFTKVSKNLKCLEINLIGGKASATKVIKY